MEMSLASLLGQIWAMGSFGMEAEFSHLLLRMNGLLLFLTLGITALSLRKILR